MSKINENNLNLVIEHIKKIIARTVKDIHYRSNKYFIIAKVYDNINIILKELDCYDILVKEITSIIVEDLIQHAIYTYQIGSMLNNKRNITCKNDLVKYIKNNLSVMQTLTKPFMTRIGNSCLSSISITYSMIQRIDRHVIKEMNININDFIFRTVDKYPFKN